MIELNTKNGLVKLFVDTVEDGAIEQVTKTAESPLGEGAHIRMMPDMHVGAGCCIGTTMRITDKVCPNLVGVDIACSVRLVKTDLDFRGQLEKLDKCIRQNVPAGQSHHKRPNMEMEWFEQLRCYGKLKREVIWTAMHSKGTLGGGNHFIEAYENGALSVHTGSRNLGERLARYYQDLAITRALERNPEAQGVEKALAYLEGQEKDDYLHDIKIVQEFARLNREQIIGTIMVGMRGRVLEVIDCSHNYIDTDTMILRKGATDASAGKKILIPLNMRDGMLICVGKGNEDWNYSAPHGAGRLYSRTAAKEKFTVSEYKKAMEGIYTTCISQGTLDEAPFAYKDWQEIARLIEPTAEILERLLPIYNFKAGGG